MANTYKVKRGMVFWYNLDERIDKNSAPVITVNGKVCRDHRQYGMRHWLVISNNAGNSTSPTCNVVPITGACGKANIPTHVSVTFRGRKFEALCEQIMTINSVSLLDYSYTLSEADMKNVEKALMVQFDFSQMLCGVATDIEPMLIKTQQRLEKLMAQFENNMKLLMEGHEKRLSALLKSDESRQQMPAAGPSSKKPIGLQIRSAKKLSQIEKFISRYPGVAPKPEMTSKADVTLKKESTNNLDMSYV